MKHMQVIAQEPYEAPAIQAIDPVTITRVVGDSAAGDNDDNGGEAGGMDDD